MFGAECYRPTRDDATLAPVAMLSAPFLDMFPSVCVSLSQSNATGHRVMAVITMESKKHKDKSF